MNTMEDILSFVVGLWIIIILFITCPIWFLPVAIYYGVKG